MNDPEYTYIKGQGWVTHAYPVITLKCGTLVRLVRRKPVEGEKRTYLSISGDPTWFHSDGSPKTEKVLNSYIFYYWHDITGYPSYSDVRELDNPDRVWFVFEKV